MYSSTITLLCRGDSLGHINSVPKVNHSVIVNSFHYEAEDEFIDEYLSASSTVTEDAAVPPSKIASSASVTSLTVIAPVPLVARARLAVVVPNFESAIAASDFTSASTITPEPMAAVPFEAIVTSPETFEKT